MVRGQTRKVENDSQRQTRFNFLIQTLNLTTPTTNQTKLWIWQLSAPAYKRSELFISIHTYTDDYKMFLASILRISFIFIFKYNELYIFKKTIRKDDKKNLSGRWIFKKKIWSVLNKSRKLNATLVNEVNFWAELK